MKPDDPTGENSPGGTGSLDGTGIWLGTPLVRHNRFGATHGQDFAPWAGLAGAMVRWRNANRTPLVMIDRSPLCRVLLLMVLVLSGSALSSCGREVAYSDLLPEFREPQFPGSPEATITNTIQKPPFVEMYIYNIDGYRLFNFANGESSYAIGPKNYFLKRRNIPIKIAIEPGKRCILFADRIHNILQIPINVENGGEYWVYYFKSPENVIGILLGGTLGIATGNMNSVSDWVTGFSETDIAYFVINTSSKNKIQENSLESQARTSKIADFTEMSDSIIVQDHKSKGFLKFIKTNVDPDFLRECPLLSYGTSSVKWSNKTFQEFFAEHPEIRNPPVLRPGTE